jgi:hypothetical protein
MVVMYLPNTTIRIAKMAPENHPNNHPEPIDSGSTSPLIVHDFLEDLPLMLRRLFRCRL